MSMKLKMAYDDFDGASVATGLSVPEGEVSLASQSAKEETDINEIVRRFGLIGSLPENVNVPVSGDFTGITDFETAMRAVTKAREDFMELPAELRYRFANDPQRLLEFCENGANRDEAVKLGLVSKPPEVTRDAVVAIDELAAKLGASKAAA